jgi:hypothetical protein
MIGIGEQYKNVLFSIFIAESFQLPFKFSRSIFDEEHFYTADYCNKVWDNLNLPYEINENLNAQRANKLDDSGKVADFSYFYIDHFDISPEINKCRELFLSNKNYEDYFNENYFNIAIHIRRSNAWDSKDGLDNLMQYKLGLYTDEFYVKFMKELINHYSRIQTKPVIINIYSQDLDLSNYIELSGSIKFHLNEDPIHSFNSLVLSDILVTGASTFSYSAGLLRSMNKKTIYLPYFHVPISRWSVKK